MHYLSPFVSTYLYLLNNNIVMSLVKHREREKEMGEVKHILLAKFKDGISEEQIDDLIKGYANLVNHVEPMKSFRW